MKITNKCEVENCGFKFQRPDRYLAHLRIHSNSRPFKCLEYGCDKAYTSSQHQKRHYIDKHVEKLWDVYVVCPHEKCAMKLKSKTNLQKHLLRKHNLDRMEHPCEKSGFQSQQLNEKHNQKETNEVNENYNKSDMKSDSSELEHKCDKCKKVFSRKSNLNQHLKLHLETKIVYECDLCPKTYYHRKNLTQHIRRKHGEETYTCKNCERNLSTKQKLDYHEKKCCIPNVDQQFADF